MGIFRVVQAFNTPLHGFPSGYEVHESDIDGTLTAADWVRLGYLEPIGGEPPVVADPVESDPPAVTG